MTFSGGALLHSASGFEMYRRTYGLISPDDVVAFLLLDREFPRSVLYCLSKAEESLHAISGTPLETFSNPAEQRLGLSSVPSLRMPKSNRYLHLVCMNSLMLSKPN